MPKLDAQSHEELRAHLANVTDIFEIREILAHLSQEASTQNAVAEELQHHLESTDADLELKMELIDDCSRTLEVCSDGPHLPSLPEDELPDKIAALSQKIAKLDSDLQAVSPNHQSRTARVTELLGYLTPLQQYHILYDYHYSMLDALIFALRKRNMSTDAEDAQVAQVVMSSSDAAQDGEHAELTRQVEALEAESRLYRLRDARFALGPLVKRSNYQQGMLRLVALGLQNEQTNAEATLARHRPFSNMEWSHAQQEPLDLAYARKRAGAVRRNADVSVGTPLDRYIAVTAPPAAEDGLWQWDDVVRMSRRLFSDPTEDKRGKGRRGGRKTRRIEIGGDEGLDEADESDGAGSHGTRMTGRTLATTINADRVKSRDIESELINGEQTATARAIKAGDEGVTDLPWPAEPETITCDVISDEDTAQAVLSNAAATREADLLAEELELQTLVDTQQIFLEQAARVARLMDDDRPMGAKSQRVTELIALQGSLLEHISRVAAAGKERKDRVRLLQAAASSARSDASRLEHVNAGVQTQIDRLTAESAEVLRSIDAAVRKARALYPVVESLTDTPGDMVTLAVCAAERLDRAATIIQAIYRGHRARIGRPTHPCPGQPRVAPPTAGATNPGLEHRLLSAIATMAPGDAALDEMTAALTAMAADLEVAREGVAAALTQCGERIDGMADEVRARNAATLEVRRMARYAQTVPVEEPETTEAENQTEDIQSEEKKAAKKSKKGKK